MRRARFLTFGGLIAVALAIVLIGLVSADQTSTIDFEGSLVEGDIVSSVSAGAGISGDDAGGFVGVFGVNPDLGGNDAMIFDAECGGGCSGGDIDLEFPGHGNTLIVTEDGVSGDPDDGDVPGSFFEFDFSTWGPGVVTVDSIDVGDVENEEAGPNIELSGPGGLAVTVPIPITGNNVIVTVPINVAGVDFMRVNINGSGTIDNIAITVVEELPEFARITGGGWRVTGSGGEDVRSSGGFTLHCDILLSNNLQINWRDGGSNKWHINKVVDAAFCEDDPDFTPEPPAAPADTYVGVDVGKLNNSTDPAGSVACWVFEDHGEVAGDPDGPDQAMIRVWDTGAGPAIGDFDLSSDDPCKLVSDPPGAETVLFVPRSDVDGNFQFHFDQPHKNK